MVEAYLQKNMSQYETSINVRKTSPHDWIRYYFHKLADEIAPKRHEIYATQESLNAVPEELRPDIGAIALESNIYYLLLSNNNLIPNISIDTPEEEVLKAVENSLKTLFVGKHILLVPGRGGQVGRLLMDRFGANVSLNSDGRYINAVLSNIHTGALGNQGSLESPFTE